MTLIGYARVSKADGSQVHDLQRNALIGAGVYPDHITRTARPDIVTIDRASPRHSRHSGPTTPWSLGSSTGSAATCATSSTLSAI